MLIVSELRQIHAVTDLVQAADIPRSVYYYGQKVSSEPERYQEEKQLIIKVFHQHEGRYGYRRIDLELRNQGHLLNHKTVQSLMGQLQLKSTVRPKKYKSYRGNIGITAPNTLNREFEAAAPNEKWVTDVTEFNVHGKKFYLSPILDLYNREIVSFQIGESAHMGMIMSMVSSAVKRLQKNEIPLLHSDQGWQYQMNLYQDTLKQHGLKQSMSRKGNCLDNAVMENFFGILKTEFYHNKKFASAAAFVRELKAYIRYYNCDRIKEKLNGLSPVQFRIQALLSA